MNHLKTTAFQILVFLSILNHSHNSYADIIEISNGQVLEVVILSEDETSIQAKTNVGIISVSKTNIISITKHTFDENKEMLAKWENKTNQKKSKTSLVKQHKKQNTDEVRYVSFKGEWIPEDEFIERIKKKELTWREKQENAKEKAKIFIDKDIEEKLIEETNELIIQGSKRRSNEANNILSKFKWKHFKTDHFIIFFDDMKLGNTLKNKAEFFLQDIATDLNIYKELVNTNDHRYEIYAIEDKEIWNSALQGKLLRDTPNGFTKIYKKEIFIFIKNEYDVEFGLSHEIAHMTLREFVNLKFNKKASIPLWLNEGYANYKGNVVNMSASKEVLLNALKYNKQFSIKDLTIINQYPARLEEKTLFYAQTTKLIQFIMIKFGRKTFIDFITTYLEEYNKLSHTEKDIDKNQSERIFKEAIRNSKINETYASFNSFEENWFKWIYES